MPVHRSKSATPHRRRQPALKGAEIGHATVYPVARAVNIDAVTCPACLRSIRILAVLDGVNSASVRTVLSAAQAASVKMPEPEPELLTVLPKRWALIVSRLRDPSLQLWHLTEEQMAEALGLSRSHFSRRLPF